ncbi:MAG: hypothetical protein AAB506_02905 [Patescibacteria group bacterium]
MNTTILQVPMEKNFKLSVQKAAEETGFSSLQDFIRFVLTQFLNKKYTVSVINQEPDEVLTPAQEKVLTKKYNQAMKEMKEGKGKTYTNVDDMMRDLRNGI